MMGDMLLCLGVSDDAISADLCEATVKTERAQQSLAHPHNRSLIAHPDVTDVR